MSAQSCFKRAGCWVVAEGLVGASHLNGLVGCCCSGGTARGSTGDRVGVDFGPPHGVKALRLSNLQVATNALPTVGGDHDAVGAYVLVRGKRCGIVMTSDSDGAETKYNIEYSDGEEEDVPGCDLRLLPQEQFRLRSESAKPCVDKDAGKLQLCLGRNIDVGWCAMQGWRPYQEDARCAFSDLSGHSGVGLACVFDGHGGNNVSTFLRNNLPEVLAQCLPSKTCKCYAQDASLDIRQQVRQALYEAFLSLDEAVPDSAKTQGSTVNAILMVNGGIIVANTGDSRSVLFDTSKSGDLQMIQASIDHCPNNENERQRIVDAGHRVERNRIDGILAVSRSIGDHEFKQASGICRDKQACIAVPDVYFYSFEKDLRSAFLVQASDGVWNCMSNLKVGHVVKEQLDHGCDVAQVASLLLDRCLSPTGKGAGTDNMAAHVIVWK